MSASGSKHDQLKKDMDDTYEELDRLREKYYDVNGKRIKE